MADFDAIVVGAGCAGSVAAYELAKAGKEVLLIERGNFAGAKNMTGGRIYAHSLRKVFPDFESEAPLERKITHERISLMTQEANLTMDFTSEAMRAEDNVSYSAPPSTSGSPARPRRPVPRPSTAFPSSRSSRTRPARSAAFAPAKTKSAQRWSSSATA